MELEERLKPFELVTDEETSVTEAFDDVPCGSASQILLINADEVKDQIKRQKLRPPVMRVLKALPVTAISFLTRIFNVIVMIALHTRTRQSV